MAVPLALVPLDGEPVAFTVEEVSKCGVLVRSGVEEPCERVPVALHRDDLLAWQRGLSSDSTPALDIVAALKVCFQCVYQINLALDVLHTFIWGGCTLTSARLCQ